MISLQRIYPLYLEPEIAAPSSKLIPSRLICTIFDYKTQLLFFPSRVIQKALISDNQKRIFPLIPEMADSFGSTPGPYYSCLYKQTDLNRFFEVVWVTDIGHDFKYGKQIFLHRSRHFTIYKTQFNFPFPGFFFKIILKMVKNQKSKRQEKSFVWDSNFSVWNKWQNRPSNPPSLPTLSFVLMQIFFL